MFWVESRLRVCTWDSAHGKPYASAQLPLSFGVGGVGARFHTCTVQIEPGRLELYPYHTFIESSEEKDAVSHSGFVKEQDVALHDINTEVKGQAGSPPRSDIIGVTS